MNKKAIAPALLLSACMTVLAQGPLSDVITISLPQMTRVGNQTLPAGEYQIRQLPTASNPRLLEFSSNSGTTLEAAITTIAALDNNNQNETSVILERQGGEYFLKYVWIKGKSYGYEIPVERTRTATASPKTLRLTAAYSPAEEPQTVAQLQPQPQGQPSTLPAEEPEAAPSPTTDTVPEPQSSPQEAARSSVSDPEQVPAPTPDSADQTWQTAARAPSDTAELPETASNLAEIALAGLAMIVVGLLIRRFERRAL